MEGAPVKAYPRTKIIFRTLDEQRRETHRTLLDRAMFELSQLNDGRGDRERYTAALQALEDYALGNRA